MDLILEYQSQLIAGTIMTIKLALSSLVVALLFGLLGAWAKLSSNRLAQRVAEIYTTIVRGIPDLVLILLVFYGGQVTLNTIGAATGLWGYIEISQFIAGVGTIGVIFGAYFTETFRGAILAIPRGQMEAAMSVGMTPRQIFRIVTAMAEAHAVNAAEVGAGFRRGNHTGRCKPSAAFFPWEAVCKHDRLTWISFRQRRVCHHVFILKPVPSNVVERRHVKLHLGEHL